MSKYITLFQNNDDIIREYGISDYALDNCIIHLAWYGYGSYEGDSLVIFEKDGKLYEVTGSHCSCYGLEGQWEPVETKWEILANRKFHSRCEGSIEAEEELQRIVKCHLNR